MRQMQFNKTLPRLGVFTSGFNGDYRSELVSGIEAAAREKGAQVLYFPGGSMHSPCPVEKRHNIIYDIALNASLDGLIILSVVTNYCREKELTEFITPYAHIPLVTLNFQAPIGNAIRTNNKAGFQALMSHLIEIHGYSKLAFVKGPEYNPEAIELFEIYESELTKAGFAVNPSLITGGNYSYFGGLMAVKEYFEGRGLKAGKDIDVIVCANDAMAYGVIDALHDIGLQVPEDIGVTGFDNIHESVFPKFPLTSVQPHLFEIGSRAVEVLVDYMPGREPCFFDSELVLRHSCGCRQQNVESPGAAVRNEAGNPGQHKKDLDFVFYKFIAIINNLLHARKKAELTDWMQNNLPTLGIKSAWLFIDIPSKEPGHTYRLLSGYDHEIAGRKEYPGIVDDKTIFNDFLSKNTGRSFSLFPLLFKDEKYGLLVIEVRKLDFLNYDTLCNLIASSIKNILMGEELEETNQQLIRSNDLLKETNVLLTEANEQKTQFFINVAHETKTPLALIRNYLDLYMEQHEPDSHLDIIKQNMDQLLTNMLNFLDVEKLQKGHVIYRHDNVIDLSEMAKMKCTLFQSVARVKDIKILLNKEDNVFILIDPLALDRIFNNLLDNAVKYTQPGGRIQVDVKSENRRAILQISDNGPGFPEESIDHIFEPYYLLSSRKNQQQGIGVGLSIVKNIVDSLGACMNVETRKIRGTCFTITFSAVEEEQAPEGVREMPVSQPVPLVWGLIKECNIEPGKPVLLVIDDHIQLLLFLQNAFKEAYNVFLARNTLEAVEKLRTIPHPDLIISDIMMNGPDGFQFLEALSSMEEYSDVPVILLTALGGEKEKVKGLNLGAVDYIEKPFSIAALAAKIEALITLRRKQEIQQQESIRSQIDQLFNNIGKKPIAYRNENLNSQLIEYGLIGREQDVVRLLLSGLMNKEIASHLNLSQRTIEYHISKIYKKCEVSSKVDLIKKVLG